MSCQCLTVISAIILITYLYLRWSFKYWERRKVFQIKPSIPMGNWKITSKKSLSLVFSDFHKEIKEKNLPYGGFYMLTSPVFMTVKPELIKDILISNFAKFGQRGVYCNEKIDPISGHLFSLPFNSWKPLRAKLTPAFTSGKLKGIFHIIDKCCNPLVEVLQQRAESGKPFDAQDYFKRFTLDTIGSAVFGIDVDGFKNENNEFKRCTDLILRPSGWYALRFTFCFALPNLASSLKVPLVHSDTEKFIFKMIKENIEIRTQNNIVRNDMFNMLLEIKNNNEDGLTIEQMAAQSFVFLLAGFETSSSTMTYAIYELGRHEDIQDRLRKEVRAVLKKYNDEITYEALQEMPYLQQVIDETLRKYPTLPHLNRECRENYTIPGTDVVIEKGTAVVISVHGLHYDPENFPDPEKFDPDRFLASNKQNIKPFTYLPFGDGPRNCIGMRMGILQVKVGLVKVLKNHKFTVCPSTKINFNRTSITLTNDTPVELFIKKIE